MISSKLFVLTITLLLCFTVQSADACMNFHISRKEAAAILTFCVVFSPVLIVGAAGVGVVNVAGKGVRKVKESSHNRKVQKLRNRFSLERDDVVDAIGGEETFQKYLQSVYEKATKTPSFDSRLEYAVALMSANDLLAAEEMLRGALHGDVSQVPPAKLGQAQYVHGVMLQQLGMYRNALEVLDAAAKTMEAAGAEAKVEVRNGLPAISLADVYNAQGSTRLHLALYESCDTADEGESIDYVMVQAALGFFDKAVQVSEVPMAAHQVNRGVALFTLGTRESNLDRSRLEDGYYVVEGIPLIKDLSLVQEAMTAFTIAAGTDGYEGVGLATEYLARIAILSGKKAEGEALHEKARDLDGSIPHDVHMADSVLKYPRPECIYEGHDASDHDWITRRFKSPTWCDSCMKFISLSEMVKEPCAECSRCKMRVHGGCKGNLHGKMCWPSYRPPVTVGCVVTSTWDKKGVTTGTVMGHSQSCDNGLFRVKWDLKEGSTRAPETDEYSYSLTVIKAANEGTAAGLSHVHKLKLRTLHRPHWCDACKKFIVGLKAYKCAECPVLVHKECVPGNATIIE